MGFKKVSLVLLLFFGTVSCGKENLEEQGGGFEGDIIIPKWEEELLEEGEASAGIPGEHYRWKNAIVHYTISSDFGSDERRLIEDAMTTISRYTCVRFVPRKQEENFILFKNGSGCNSHVGRQQHTRDGQVVTLERATPQDRSTCVTKGVVMHEVLHALGLWHEQSRPDRDQYVTVVEKNIKEKNKHNFDAHTDSLTFQLPYDYDSVMHYEDDAFTKKNGEKTLVPKKAGVKIGQRTHISFYDILKINEMYKCSQSKNVNQGSEFRFMQALSWLRGNNPQVSKIGISKLKLASNRRSKRVPLPHENPGIESLGKIFPNKEKVKPFMSSGLRKRSYKASHL